MSGWREKLPGFAVLVGLLILWELSVRLKWVVTPTWPAVSTVLETFWQSLIDGTYLQVFGSSLERLLYGYIVATVLAVAIGIAMREGHIFDDSKGTVGAFLLGVARVAHSHVLRMSHIFTA